MSLAGSWSPDGWEWIVDLEEGPQGYAYVLTDGTLHTFDPLGAGDGLEPLEADELVVPGSCWLCGGTDWAFDLEIEGNTAYVATWSGVHVFDLSDPESPVEVGYMATEGPIWGVESFHGILYLAEVCGVTVVSAADPTAPVKTSRVALGAPVLDLALDADGWRLMALTPGSLRRLDLGRNPFSPTQGASLPIAGLALPEMEVENGWTYLSGLWTATVFDEGGDGLSPGGPHDLRAWVDGAIVGEEVAQRVKWLSNAYEVWEAE